MMTMGKENLRCVVEIITYHNTENGYTVLKCRAKNFSDLVTVVGAMPDTHVGSVLSLTGEWRVNPKYGRQFDVETFEETLPATVFGIEKYLGKMTREQMIQVEDAIRESLGMEIPECVEAP